MLSNIDIHYGRVTVVLTETDCAVLAKACAEAPDNIRQLTAPEMALLRTWAIAFKSMCLASIIQTSAPLEVLEEANLLLSECLEGEGEKR